MSERPLLSLVATLALGAVALVLAATLPPAALVVLNNTVTLALFGMGANLLLGTTGLLSFGQAIFFGIGSYLVAMSWFHGWTSFWVAASLAPVAGAVTALAVGALALRSRRWFFALLTLGFSQLFFTIAQKASSLTEGDSGIFGPMVPRALADPHGGSLFIVAVATVAVVLLWVISSSELGLTLRAIRDNARRAMGLGIDVYRTRLLAFVLSGAFCALAGVLDAVNQQAAYPGLLDWEHSGDAVIVSVIGGMSSFLGPVLGAVVYQIGHDFLVRATLHWQLALGVVLLLTVMLFPDGLARLPRPGLWRDAWRAVRGRAGGGGPR